MGGVAFVSSLSYFVYFYLSQLGRPAAAPMASWTGTIINFLLFTAFAAHHSIMARSGAKAWLERSVPPCLERSVYVWISSVLFVAVCASWRRIDGVLYTVPTPVSWIGYALQACGVALVLRSSAALSFLELAGIKQVQEAVRTDGESRAGAESDLITTGPYAIVRHPLYLGWVLLVFAAPLMTADRFSFATISTLYLVVAVPWEERALRRAFGEGYLRYAERTRWRIVPGVY
jgi:protein-S-isoprenylcysteine O-methyltransferase Ste14